MSMDSIIWCLSINAGYEMFTLLNLEYHLDRLT